METANSKVSTLPGKISEETLDEILRPLNEKQKKLILTALQPENKLMSRSQISLRAGYERYAWRNSVAKNREFGRALSKLGIKKGGTVYPPHHEATLCEDPIAESEKDVWDLRRFYKDYPRHLNPSYFIVNFSEIRSTGLRRQVKWYLKSRIGVWKPRTFESEFDQIKEFCNTAYDLFPDLKSFSNLKREHIEKILLELSSCSVYKRTSIINYTRTMFDYMIRAGLRNGPARDLFWREDLPKESVTLPDPLPPYICEQLDRLLEEVAGKLAAGQELPIINDPFAWDALIVLRYTGRRLEDIAHLQYDCLRFDEDGDPYIYMDHRISKTSIDLSIPISHLGNLVVDAIRRQQQRAEDYSPVNGIKYLFMRPSARNKAVLNFITGDFMNKAVLKLISEQLPLVNHNGETYYFTSHKCRHTVAKEMIDAGVDIYAVKEFLGHASLRMTEKYIRVYQERIKQELQKLMPHSDAKEVNARLEKMDAPYTGKWTKEKIAIFRNGEGGWCEHPFKMPACPQKPVCRTCVKFKSDESYIPIFKKDIENYQELYNKAVEMGMTGKALEYKRDLDIAKGINEKLLKDKSWDGSKDLPDRLRRG